MHELPPEELLSAYLDGEVTADEQAQAERLLAESADARRLFEELQTLRSHFDCLPHSTLPTDFGQRVLRQAERDILRRDDTDGGAAERLAGDESTVEPQRDAASEVSPTERIRKPLLYAMLAVATVVLLSVFNPAAPQRKAPNRNVALVDEDERIEPWSEAAPAQPDASDEPADQIATVAGPARPAAGPATTSSAAPDSPPMRKGGAQPDEVQLFSDSPAGNVGESKPGLAKDAGRGVVVSSGLAPVGNGTPGIVANPTSGLGLQTGDSDGNGLLIVQCDVSAAVADSGAFGKLLARQQIQWKRLAEFPATEPVAEGLSAAGGEEQAAGAVDRKPVTSRDKNLEKKASGKSLAANGASSGDYDLIYIEATPQQLEATLTELSSLPDTYLSVEVAPAAGAPQQQRWQTQYARGRALNYRQLPAQQQQLGDMVGQQSSPTGDRRAEISKAGEPSAPGPAGAPKAASPSALAGTKPATQTIRGTSDPAASSGGSLGGGGGGGFGGGGSKVGNAPRAAPPAPTASQSQVATQPPATTPKSAGASTQIATPAPSTSPTQATPPPLASQPVANAPGEKLAEAANSPVVSNETKYNNATQAGRARSYSLPADANPFYEQGKAQVAQRKGDVNSKAPEPAEQSSKSPSKPSSDAPSEEPPLLRALFVLQVAPPEEASAPAAAPSPAKP